MRDSAVTEDGFLGGRLRLRQPAAGFRSGADAVFLAAAVPDVAGRRVLDAGAGVGAAGLCLAVRRPDLQVTGLELQHDLAALANDNAARNGLAGRMRAVAGDLRSPPADVPGNGFDVTICNPPWFADAAAPRAPDPGRAAARHEGEVTLPEWVRFCLSRCRPGGCLVFVHVTERMAELLAALSEGAGALALCPLWPKAGQPSKRFIVRGFKGARAPLTLHAGLVLHEADGRYAAAAEAVLRDGAPLPF